MSWSPDSQLLAVTLCEQVKTKDISHNCALPFLLLLDKRVNLINASKAMTLQMHAQEKGTAGSNECSRIQLWQRSNWHWYLKTEMRGLGSVAVFTGWQEEGLCLTIVTSAGLCSAVSMSRLL